MRYRFDDKTGRMLRLNEKTGKWVQDRTKRNGFDFDKPMTVMLDIQEFMAYATEKPQLITSRSQLARYERSNGIRQCGDFKRGEIAERRRKKIERETAEAVKRAGVPMSALNWTDF